MGSEGEDVVADDGGGLKLACPARFQPGTMKAAAWQVRCWQRAGPHAPRSEAWDDSKDALQASAVTVSSLPRANVASLR